MSEAISLETKKDLLKQQACFNKLNDVEIEALTSLLIERQYHPGDVIVEASDAVDSIYIIVSGVANVKLPNQSIDQAAATLSKGDAIGLNESGFFSSSGERTATVVAASEMTVLRLSVATFHGFALTFPHVGKVMSENAEKFLNINRWTSRLRTPS